MVKRYSIIALLLFAYTIVMAHHIIPHHHHDEEEEMSTSIAHEDSGSNHHHDGDSDDDGSLSHEFKKYLHASGTDDIYQKSELKITYSSIATAYIAAVFEYKIRTAENSLPARNFCNDFIPISCRYLSPKGLRAPPLA